ncbi:hypothetical protein X740_21240 [Mesorhizobium sp. LNHC221B00]|uniref:hypothetical protein n=1 Tax=Mesorhizobium sp. LNHC221B00 TaxID=1287233 RepID=UPI0003CE4781|nr:hypothetical protein [Mesorhizobium sp. LNHC221B00]ESY78099.1 hypothetical protein X740_21240 [Mesorhizobium sp. LNHC221B00]
MPESESEYQFIELNRTFHELSRYANEDNELDLSHAFHVGDRLSWSNLIERYRVIILSEAGSGKTAEIRNVALDLRAQGKSAFFIRLEHVPNDFEDGFEVGTFEEFESWLGSNDEGWLLLDSVDEARLRNPGDFALAIKKLGRRIATAKDRTHIVVTGRTNAWRPKTDLALCVTHLPFTLATTTAREDEASHTDDTIEDAVETSDRPAEKSQPVFKIVTLDDLSRSQIEEFASARAINDTKAFIESIERADAWSFTSRPQDLMELTEFWLDQGRIGSRLEIMRNSISRRLQERDQGRIDVYPLAPQKALQGARLIAAATTLAQDSTIRVPDGAENSKGIALHDVLPDWDDRERSTLLSRPIFDEAIYGTVRFHHRSVREYLAAEWFAALLSRETSRRKIEALFFTNQYGLDIIVPTLRPILPWLAILDSKIRERLRKVAPEVVFEGGDPSQLPLETRKLILHEACEQLASGTSGRSMTDYAAVQRFSNPDLTDDVRRLLAKYATDEELKAFLLRMVWLGQLSGALPEAKQIALSPSASQYTRIAAFRAVRAIGPAQDQEDIRNIFLAEAAELDRDWLAELTKETAPRSNTIKWLLKCLGKTEDKERYSVDRLSDAVSTFVQAADLEQLPELLIGFDQLLNTPPVIERRFCEISEKFTWLMTPAFQAVERLIQARHAASLGPPVLSVLDKFGMGRHYFDSELNDAKSKFSTFVPEWPELNRALFWYEINVVRDRRDQKRNERLTDFWPVFVMEPFWRFGAEDFDYVSEQIETQSFQDDKLVALSLSFRLYVTNDRPRIWREQLKRLTSGNAELSDELNKLLNPPAQGKDARAWKRQEAQWKRRSEERKRKEEKNLTDSKKYLSENLDKLRDPSLTMPGYVFNGLTYLHDRMRRDGDRSGRWTHGNWKILGSEFGEDVAQAFRDGIVARWRRETPVIRSEGAPENSTPMSVILGLAGLEIEAQETPNWAQGLSEADIELVCRYASFELNGFPTWFPKLFEVHTSTVTDFLLQEVRFELSKATPEKEDNYVLSDVSWSGEWSWATLGPHIADLLKESEPANTATLGRLLKILQGSALSDEQVSDIASQKVRSVRASEHVAHWYAVWVGVDPEAAIPDLATYFEKLSDGEARTEFAMSFVTNLWGGRRSAASTRAKYQTPRHLKTLYLLMHGHIRRSEDIDRAGKGVYSPGLRDNAQDSRNGLFDLLNKIPGKEAFVALQEISQSHPEVESRPWFAHLAKVKAEQDSDIASWTPGQVRDFHDKLERTPANHRELAELAIMRFLDLKDDLENGDSSIAAILKAGATLETDMRKYIGREFREKASARYSVPQEEEFADAKKPDIRFHGMGFDAPVPAELKLADKWTGPELFERLENQLCGDYLRDNRSMRGIFVLVRNGEKAGWDVPGAANRVDFEGLIAALQNRWEEISHAFPGVDEVTVIGLDLLKRAA